MKHMAIGNTTRRPHPRQYAYSHEIIAHILSNQIMDVWLWTQDGQWHYRDHQGKWHLLPPDTTEYCGAILDRDTNTWYEYVETETKVIGDTYGYW